MVFYCFPRIIGRVHREGKAIHQNTAEREKERSGDREKGMEGHRCVRVCGEGVSIKMEGLVQEDRGKGVWKNGEKETERIRGARW